MLTDSERERIMTEALARILELFTAAVLTDRIEQARQGRKLAEQQREAKGLADAVDDWLNGEGNQ